ncbi:protein jag [Mobilicoccus caccae]|uniref:Single-stranded DNA-binding protein n=1 Tax=Mobilicoccus caccae TaxID=1859295 RepID=A0ABQ6IV48_9MICO|nr:R3H domain-containing nucleic acid-binding protein [Mobilicoccus caccae]GMA41814.1 single-stranded DNA-binding protein [Mobilicoccus caccae]
MSDTETESIVEDPAKGVTGDAGADAVGEETERGGDRPARSGGRIAQLEREGEVAADFLERLLDIADLDGDIDVDIEGDRAVIAIVDSEEGRVPRRLVGPDGKVLEALQELTRLAVQTETGEHTRLMLDVAGHRAERRRAVIDIARAAVARCRETGEPQPLEPMSAFERKVAHDEVLRSGLHSESEGVEPRRHVVVHPA